jgi:hypothetical protein
MDNEKIGITYQADELEVRDDRHIFYGRELSGKQLVIIPKNAYKMFETDSTYVLEMIPWQEREPKN